MRVSIDPSEVKEVNEIATKYLRRKMKLGKGSPETGTAKIRRFMPPRYYQLKEERGAYQGTIDFLNTWLVNKYADVIGLQDQIEQERGQKLPESQRFSEVEQLMYGRALLKLWTTWRLLCRTLEPR